MMALRSSQPRHLHPPIYDHIDSSSAGSGRKVGENPPETLPAPIAVDLTNELSKGEHMNKKNKNGSWTLSGAYLEYRNDGGQLDPETWNALTKELLSQK